MNEPANTALSVGVKDTRLVGPSVEVPFGEKIAPLHPVDDPEGAGLKDLAERPYPGTDSSTEIMVAL